MSTLSRAVVIAAAATALVLLTVLPAGATVLAPTITSITPNEGTIGNSVSATIIGTGLVGTVRVWLSKTGKSDIECSGISVNPDGTLLTCGFQLPDDTSYVGAWDVNVQTASPTPAALANGFTVLDRQGPPPGPPPAIGPFPTWYLAEGSTAWGFSQYISIINPNPEAVTTRVTYMTTTGATSPPDVTLPAASQTTINPRDYLGDQDFSTKVECLDNETIAVDRTMTWTGPGAASPEAHNSIGVPSPEKTWYLPEGSSAWGFECWLLIQNPNDSEATCTVTYMIEGEGPKTFTKKVPANSRKTFNMADDIGSKDASIKVESDLPVIPERAMYRNNRREGHDSIGTTTPDKMFYLAEGTTAYGFTTYVLVQNPQETPTDVIIIYMTPSGTKEQKPFTMPANSRKTIRLNDNPDIQSTDVSTALSGSQPIIAERAMYWGVGSALGEACHDSIGVAAPHSCWYLPDGETSNGRETYTLVQNPSQGDFDVQVTYLTYNGVNNQTDQATVKAGTRHTFVMSDKVSNGRAAILVTPAGSIPGEGAPLIVERSMYWNNRGAGTDTVGGYEDPGLPPM